VQSKTTLGEYLDEWLKSYAKSNVSAKTFERYEELIRLSIKPKVGQITLAKLQPIQVQSLYTELLESGRKKPSKTSKSAGLSAQTVLHVHRLLHEALRHAVRWQILIRNPCDAVDPPRPEQREIRTLNEAESAWLLEAAEPTRFYPGMLIGISTGLRRGEVLALRWKDVNLAAGRLTVSQAMEKTNDGIRFKQPKTKRSRRTIPVPPFAIRGLTEFEKKQQQEKLLYGPDYDDHDLICAQPDGSPIDPDVYSSDVIVFLKTIGLRGVSFHKLRHSHATQLLAQNVHPKIVQERLGHSSIAITLDLYSHVMQGLQGEAVAKLDSLISREIAKQKQQARN
jgi:integrase